MKTATNYRTMNELDGKMDIGASRWLERLNTIIDENIADPTFDNDRLARELGVSERNLFRKVNELTGMPPQKYLRKHKMKQAMDSLTNGQYRTVNETAYSVGYLNVSYFISQFEKEYNLKPLQVLQNYGWR